MTRFPTTDVRPAPIHWQPLSCLCPPWQVRPWLHDRGSLTRALQRLGSFRVEPLYQAIANPRIEEQRLLQLPQRQQALIREVLLRVDDEPLVFARSVLPLTSLVGGNRLLGHMANRSLGAELFRRPRAIRHQVWGACVATDNLPVAVAGPCWGRQSLFFKRRQPLLVAEIFLPALWQRLGAAD